MKQAFIARIEIEMPVWAEDHREAQRIAVSHLRDESIGPEDFEIVDFYPLNDCDDDSVLYSNGNDTVCIGDLKDDYEYKAEDTKGSICIGTMRDFGPDYVRMRLETKGYRKIFVRLKREDVPH